MKIHRSIDSGSVLLGLEAEDLEGAMNAVAREVSADLGVPAQTLSTALLERERLGSTSVGDGFAIPHCKLPGLKHIRIVLARLETGIPFSAADGKPVSFFFVVLSPPDQPAAHLQVLSQIARVLKHGRLRSELLQASDAESMIEAVRQAAETEGL